jgi:hypothetical protein
MEEADLGGGMIRSMSVVVALCAVIGCSNSTDPEPEQTSQENVVKAPSAATFTGTWRSVTPSMEFIGLSVQSKSSEVGVLAARLTFSGVYWEGSGRIDGDSYIADMGYAGARASTALMVVRARDAQTLRVQFRSGSPEPLDLTFVREN